MNWLNLLTGAAPPVSIPEGRKHECQDDGDPDGMCADIDLEAFGLQRKYGKLTVLRLADSLDGLRWWCACECGKTKAIPYRYLKRGTVKTCGCSRKEQAYIPVHSGYAKFGFPCACGCGRITKKYEVVKGMRKGCHMRLKKAGKI